MAKAYTYSFRDLEKILRKNGYSYIRSNGSHKIFTNGLTFRRESCGFHEESGRIAI